MHALFPTKDAFLAKISALKDQLMPPFEALPDLLDQLQALFKTIGGGGIHFAEDLRIHEPKFTDVDNGHGSAEYQGHKGHLHFDYHFKYLEGVLMVHTIAKD